MLLDKRPDDSRYFYRIKQIDIDGAFDYSKVVELSLEALPLELKAYPNPARDFVNIEIRGGSESSYELGILNSNGTNVYSERIESGGIIEKRIKLNEYPAGVYIISVQTESGNQSLNLIIDR